jgi:hypothetical protein
MKSVRFSTILIGLLIFAFAMFAPVSVSAAPEASAPVACVQPSISMQEEEQTSLPDLATSLKTFAGVVALIPAIINLGKTYAPKYFPNNSAPKWELGLQTLALVGLVSLQLTGRADLVPVFDEQAGVLAIFLTGTVALVLQLFFGRIVHEEVLAGLPGIGKTHTGYKAGQKPKPVGTVVNNLGTPK